MNEKYGDPDAERALEDQYCPRCGQNFFAHNDDGSCVEDEPDTQQPSFEQLQEWLIEDSGCEATDGCWVEPDGTCPHGHKSWLLKLGLI